MKKSEAFFRSFEVILLAFIAWLSVACAPATTTSATGSLLQGSSLSAVSGTLSLSAASSTVAMNGTVQFSASGGTGTYSYFLVSGSGSISSAGLLTATSSNGVIEVEVEDSAGDIALAEVSVGASTNGVLTLSPTDQTLTFGETLQLTPSGGTGTYLYYEVLSGGGSVTAAGLYTAPNSIAVVTVGVEDSSGNWGYAYFTVNSASSSSPSSGGVSSTETYGICSTATSCYQLFGLNRELDGRTTSAAQVNAYAACIFEGYTNLVTYETTAHSITCGNLYGLANWTANQFFIGEYPICKTGTVTVVSGITCSN